MDRYLGYALSEIQSNFLGNHSSDIFFWMRIIFGEIKQTFGLRECSFL